MRFRMDMLIDSGIQHPPSKLLTREGHLRRRQPSQRIFLTKRPTEQLSVGALGARPSHEATTFSLSRIEVIQSGSVGTVRVIYARRSCRCGKSGGDDTLQLQSEQSKKKHLAPLLSSQIRTQGLIRFYTAQRLIRFYTAQRYVYLFICISSVVLPCFDVHKHINNVSHRAKIHCPRLKH